jgi:hypothetical protein
VPTEIDKHIGSNLLKTNAAPFIYKPKQTVEIQGVAATVRLHDPKTGIYIRGFGIPSEDAADPSQTPLTQTRLALIKLEPRRTGVLSAR